ncbi:MAG: A/G-specific adenine glycosylase [Verrucomicrobiota bacterium]
MPAKPPDPDAFRQALADWYARARRPLPWRAMPSLYRTVVSELMAQQTQIKTMLPYFERWMRRFPDFEMLAEAPAEDVLKHWEGLGYYSRARNLHRLAKAYVAMDPKPRTAAEWRALPGIGLYTSAAIASICFDEPVAVVDGNVVRILARLNRDTRSFKNNAEAVKAFAAPARRLVDPEHPGDHNQAMMELGATVCLKHKPLCTVCPVLAFCQAAARGDADRLPRIQRKATEQVEVDRLWIVRHDRLLLHRIPEDARQLAGQYELPRPADLGLAPPRGKPLATKTRGITHRRIKERIYAADTRDIPESARLEWVALRSLDQITLSGPHRRWVGELIKKVDR